MLAHNLNKPPKDTKVTKIWKKGVALNHEEDVFRVNLLTHVLHNSLYWFVSSSRIQNELKQRQMKQDFILSSICQLNANTNFEIALKVDFLVRCFSLREKPLRRYLLPAIQDTRTTMSQCPWIESHVLFELAKPVVPFIPLHCNFVNLCFSCMCSLLFLNSKKENRFPLFLLHSRTLFQNSVSVLKLPHQPRTHQRSVTQCCFRVFHISVGCKVL